MNENQDGHQHRFWFRQLPLESETCFFILINALDVVVTWMLLTRGPQFQESNLVAHWFLKQFGFRGMVYFKFALVAFVTVIAQIIARTHLQTARRLLVAGIAISSMVVVYSLYLWVRHTGYFG